MLLVIFISCHTIMPCCTVRHNDLVADRHCLKFHGRFCSDESSRSCCKCITGPTSPSYTICIVEIHSLQNNHPTFHQPWGSSANSVGRGNSRVPLPGKPKLPLTPLQPPTPPQPPPPPPPPLLPLPLPLPLLLVLLPPPSPLPHLLVLVPPPPAIG